MEDSSGSAGALTNEVYALDFNRDANMVVAGGGNNSVIFYRLVNGEYVTDEEIEGFSDSVVFVGFTKSTQVVAVTMDGTIAQINTVQRENRAEKEVHLVETHADVTCAALDPHRENLYVGTALGLVEKFPCREPVAEERTQQMVYAGHGSEIVSIEVGEKEVATASAKAVIIFASSTGHVLGRYAVEEDTDIRSMKIDEKWKIAIIGHENGKVVVLSLPNMKAVHITGEAEPVEVIAAKDDAIIFGGFGNFVTHLDLRYKTEKKWRFEGESFCVVKILIVTEYVSIIVTNSGRVVVIDARSENAVLKDKHVAACVLDAILAGKTLCLGTDEGTQFVDLAKL